MRKILIAVTALAVVTGSAVGAQMQSQSQSGMHVGGGHMGGQWQGGSVGGGQWQSQGGAGQWQRGAGGGQWQGGGRTVGGDPRTWSPTTPRVGGDPRTWGPGNQPGRPGGQWQGGSWHGGGASWGGGYVGGRWDAGNRAPGGWGGYRRPSRGWTMPGYWQSPDYRIYDYGFWGLQAPPQGYGWSRYYDDAVLVDDYGRVYDSVSGIDWRRADQPYPTGYGYPSQGYANAPGYYYDEGSQRCRKRGKGSGVGGALIGGAIGAGISLLAGGGTGTTLIAGGGGALLGQQVDRETRARYVCDGRGYPVQAYDDGYAGQGYAQNGYAYAGDGYAYAQGGAGGYSYQGGYSYAPVIATATVDFGGPVVTTTTTTTTEEWVSRPVVRDRVVYRTIIKRAPVKKWRPAPKPVCTDQCECGKVCGS